MNDSSFNSLSSILGFIGSFLILKKSQKYFIERQKYLGKHKFVAFYKEDDYPVFARAGSIIPLSKKGNINNTSSPTDLEIQVFAGASNNYTMYEDDGISSLYKEGYYLKTSIDYNYLKNNYTVIIRSIDGKSGIVPEKRNYKMVFRNTREADDVTVFFNSDQINNINTYVDANDFVVELKDIPKTNDELIAMVDKYIHFYNCERPQRKLKGMTPMEYRESYLNS